MLEISNVQVLVWLCETKIWKKNQSYVTCIQVGL